MSVLDHFENNSLKLTRGEVSYSELRPKMHPQTFLHCYWKLLGIQKSKVVQDFYCTISKLTNFISEI